MSTAAATTDHGDESTASLPLHSTAPPPHFTLYTYWRSSCTWRVRIALHYKQLTYTPQIINLLKGEQNSEEYGRVNPSHTVPTLVVSYQETQQQLVLQESLSILEWLDETHPSPPLLPTEPNARAKVRYLALLIAAGTQPASNLKLLNNIMELTGKEEEKQKWAAKRIEEGLKVFEHAISFTAGTYCFGNTITYADMCIVPQLMNARRYKIDMTQFPNIVRVEAALSQHPAFIAAHPDAQPDNPEKNK